MDRFIVGTGRCGSTLLSRMIALHPAVLSVFEFFNGLDVTRRFSPEPVSGAEIAALVAAEQPFLTAVMRRGYAVPEVIYPFDGDTRHKRSDPLPWILVGTLPRLSERPDALFDEVMAFLAELPPQPAVAHYRRLFDWLCERLGRELWIERAGSSIDYLGSLIDSFPEARFLHIHRDGPEAALSMREHHAYRLPISVMYQVPVDGRPWDELGPFDVTALPTGNDAVSRILASLPPAEYFGQYWTDQLVRGFAAVPRLGAWQYTQVAFEDLVTRPREVLRGVADFFELEHEQESWIESACDLVRGVPATRAGALPPDERERLEAACRAGRELLGRAG